MTSLKEAISNSYILKHSYECLISFPNVEYKGAIIAHMLYMWQVQASFRKNDTHSTATLM